ncbi:glutamate-5-semialdehyde dehydrogenase [Temperatibacter marinus]|uniref:Gamma-glutamyl phosphate reductase n=1 Tax=Temperatibacter marinus TaxID=1456591 RepID=A0AA52H8H2_9PROT|nr:glutamate-5-semialdehyde dehydrogenase [Temperatibacter marinus]WND01447.1 glutamate-5-semialdehyde dehydrogenase [Temperatibacter marinus]
MDELIKQTIDRLCDQAVIAAKGLAVCSADLKNKALLEAAKSLRHNAHLILEANLQDMQTGAEKGLSSSMLDRLYLDQDRIDAMAQGLEAITRLEDPVGQIMDQWSRPNGLDIQRVRTPLGVVGVIYESRPNVTADAAALCLKAGNAVILRGGSECLHSNKAILTAMLDGFDHAGLPKFIAQLVPMTDREAVGHMLKASGKIDVIVPRGGKSLVSRVQEEARVPVFAHLEGVNHIYVDKGADQDRAAEIIVNSKMRRPGVCGAVETVLIHQDEIEMMKHICSELKKAGCRIRGGTSVMAHIPYAELATNDDWDTEYLDTIVAVRTVSNMDRALDFISLHSSHHTDCIITETQENADRFLRDVDSAIVMHNASTQFADGGEFGMGAEIGIATGRIHARGPVGCEQLTTFKYRVLGQGQLRL